MKKQYITPTWRLHCVATSDIIITSDPQLSDDPSDGGGPLAKPRDSAWTGYEYKKSQILKFVIKTRVPCPSHIINESLTVHYTVINVKEQKAPKGRRDYRRG